MIFLILMRCWKVQTMNITWYSSLKAPPPACRPSKDAFELSPWRCGAPVRCAPSHLSFFLEAVDQNAVQSLRSSFCRVIPVLPNDPLERSLSVTFAPPTSS